MSGSWPTSNCEDWNGSPAAMFALLDHWQRGFPLVSRPFAVLAAASGLTEEQVLAGLSKFQHEGVLGRVGATIRPNTVGVSMLAAMSVPSSELDEVARIVNAEPGVNHNYEREHPINLWFVIAAADQPALAQSLNRIRRATGRDILELPLESAYYIDLGFPLSGADTSVARIDHRTARQFISPGATPSLDQADLALLAVLERGLMLVPEPYAALANELGLDEQTVIARISRLIEIGVITRFGLIVRHRRLGYRANAMVVWDVADSEVDDIGARFAAESCVTLCYRRPRRLPDWPYNLFCMVHGQHRPTVLSQVESLARLAGVEARPRAVLFSRRCYLQRGTRVPGASAPHQEAAQ